MRLGLTPLTHVLSDEKFSALKGKSIYLFLVSQGELIWYVEWLKQANVAAFEPAISNFLSAVNDEPQLKKQLPPALSYTLQTALDRWLEACPERLD